MKEVFLHRLIVTAAALVLGEVPCGESSGESSWCVCEVWSTSDCNSIFSDMSLCFQVLNLVFHNFREGTRKGEGIAPSLRMGHTLCTAAAKGFGNGSCTFGNTARYTPVGIHRF